MSASSMMMTMGSMMTTTTTAPQRPGVGVRRIATPSASFNNDVRSAGGKRRLHHRGSRARLRCDAAAGDGGAGGEDDELFEGDLLANNAASVNGKLRTLVVGITDEQGEAGPGCASSSIFNRPSFACGARGSKPFVHFARLITERHPSLPSRGFAQFKTTVAVAA